MVTGERAMGETKPEATGMVGSIQRGVGQLRSSASTINRILVLGFASVVASSMLRWSITLNILVPLLADRPVGFEPGYTSDLILGSYQQLSLLIVLPLLAWGAGWLFDGRALPLTLGAAIFHEAWMGFVSYLSDGTAVFVERPLLVITRFVLAIGIAFLAARAFRHARGRLEAMSEERRRKAPAADAALGTSIPPLTQEAVAAAREAAGDVLGDEEVIPDEVVPRAPPEAVEPSSDPEPASEPEPESEKA